MSVAGAANQSETRNHISHCDTAKSHIKHMGTYEHHPISSSLVNAHACRCTCISHPVHFHASVSVLSLLGILSLGWNFWPALFLTRIMALQFYAAPPQSVTFAFHVW